MAKQFFKDLPDTTTPLTANRLNGLLDGEEAMGNLVVDSIRSKNMFGAYTFLNGYYTSDGTYNTAATNGTFEFIEVKPSTTYVFSLSSSIRTINISEFNSSKTWIKRTLSSNNVSSFSITTASTTKYIALCLNIDNSTTVTSSAIENLSPQLEEGSTATNYVPYQELNPDNFKNEEIVVGSIRSKNIFSFNYEVTDTAVTHIISNNTIIQTNTGAYARSSWKITNLTIGTTYTLSCNYTNSNSCSLRLSIFNSTNSTMIAETTATTSTSGSFNLTFTASETTHYIRFGTNTTSSGNTNSVTFSNIQLETGSTATNYMPYQNLNGMENYSTEEVVIGTFLGKPLYRKVINLGNLPNNTTKNILHNISNLDVLVNCYGTAKRTDGNILILPNVDKDGLQYSVRLSANSYQLIVTTGSDRSAFSGYAVMEYTKTTD